jgi:uncharacterized repeat protein (TIGR01451 family)
MFNLVVDTDNAQSGAVVTNTATITSNSDFNSTNNSSTSSGTTMLAVPLAPFVDVSINKEANTSSTPVGSQITYTLTYINNGNRTANNVVVTDTLPV